MKTDREQLIDELTDIYIDLVKDKESALNYAMGESRKVDVSKLAVDHLRCGVSIRIDSILRSNNF